MDVRNFSPFYKTFSPLVATAQKGRKRINENGGAEMVVKEGKKNDKETVSLGRLGKRKKKENEEKEKENGGEAVAQWGRGDGGKRRQEKRERDAISWVVGEEKEERTSRQKAS